MEVSPKLALSVSAIVSNIPAFLLLLLAVALRP